jgi:translation elongation factor EF-Ts
MAAEVNAAVVVAIMRLRNPYTGSLYTEDEAREILRVAGSFRRSRSVHSTAREGAVSVSVKKGVVSE